VKDHDFEDLKNGIENGARSGCRIGTTL